MLPTILALLSIVHRSVTVTDAVDLIERNHFYDDECRLVFEQVIFYDWSEKDGRYQVRAWRLIKDPSHIPVRDYQTGGYRATWIDGDILRCIYSKSYQETFTQHDPELIERQFLEKERRKPLREPPPSLQSRRKK